MELVYTKDDIKKIRFILGVSQAEFANILGYSTNHIAKIETGLVPVSRQIVEKIDSKIVGVYLSKEMLIKLLSTEFKK